VFSGMGSGEVGEAVGAADAFDDLGIGVRLGTGRQTLALRAEGSGRRPVRDVWAGSQASPVWKVRGLG
jgi:hypothetical protein